MKSPVLHHETLTQYLPAFKRRPVVLHSCTGHTMKTQACWCAAGHSGPVYSPVSPHCFAAWYAHRNRWFLSQACTEKTKGGCCGHPVHYMTNSFWETNSRDGSYWRPDNPSRIAGFLVNEESHVFLSKLWKTFQVSCECGWISIWSFVPFVMGVIIWVINTVCVLAL